VCWFAANLFGSDRPQLWVAAAAEEIERAGGKALACVGDIRDDTVVTEAISQTIERFGGIDILVNNAPPSTSPPLMRCR
jgi:NAD(P)-dependent dehydrogenase (short-subunit alcohol dehydrogenase family)